MKKAKAIIFTTWFILAVVLVITAPFIFEIITESLLTLLVLNMVIPAVVLIGDDEILYMNIF